MGNAISSIGKAVGKIDPLGKKINTKLGLIQPDPTNSSPAPQNMTTEAQQTLAAEEATAQQQLSDYQKYAPAYNQTNTQMLGQSLFGPDYTGNLSDINSKFASNQQALLQQLNPNFYGDINSYATAQADPNGYNAQLQKQAQDFLNLGGNLTPSELRLTQQASRGGFAARGLDASNASIADETLQTDAAYRQRLAENLGLSTTLNSQANMNLQSGINARQLGYFDPSQYTNALLGNVSASNLQQSPMTQQQFNPFTSYASNLYDTNFNAASAANISAQNNQGAQNGATIGAIGTIAGTALLVF